MESSIEKLEGLAHKLTVEIPAGDIDQAVTQRLKSLRPRLRIDGFRPGKVPPHIIKQRYGISARQDVLGDEIDRSYREIISKSDYAPVAPPQIELISGFKEGEALKFEAIFEVMPEVVVDGLDALDITLPDAQLSDKDVDEMIDTLRRQRANFVESDKIAGNGDRLTLDFIGTLNGEPFEGGKGEDFCFNLGSGQMLPDFERGLQGMKAGEEKSFDVQFPEDYPSENLAGKTAQFAATLKKVEAMILPEVDESFIKAFGIASGDAADFRKAIRDNMSRELEKAKRRIKRERLFDAILEKNADQIVPNASLHQEMERMAKEFNLEKQIPDTEKRHQLMHQLFEKNAKRRIQLGLLLGKLFDERQIEIDQSRVQERLDSIAATYEDPEEVKKWYQNDEKSRRDLEAVILEEQLIDQLYEKAKVSYETRSFQEIMAVNAQIHG